MRAARSDRTRARERAPAGQKAGVWVPPLAPEGRTDPACMCAGGELLNELETETVLELQRGSKWGEKPLPELLV